MAPLPTYIWSRVFQIKGVWNMTVTVVFLFADDAVRARLGASVADPAYRAMFLGLAFIFGVGYWRASRDPAAHRETIRGGVWGQFWVFAVLFNEVCLARRLPAPFLVMGVVDLAFALLFMAYLWSSPSDRKDIS